MMNTVWRWSTCAENMEETVDLSQHASVYDTVACSKRMYVCVTDLYSLPEGMQALQLMVGQLCERHLCPTCPQYTHTHSHREGPYVGVNGTAKSFMSCVPTHIQQIMDHNRNHLQGSFAVGATGKKIHWLFQRKHTAATHIFTIIHVGLLVCTH